MDYFKIDGSFVRDMQGSPLAEAVVRSINEIAHVLDKRSIAEHTETDLDRQALMALGVLLPSLWLDAFTVIASALLVGGLGIAHAVSAYITERQRSIATMKALGAVRSGLFSTDDGGADWWLSKGVQSVS